MKLASSLFLGTALLAWGQAVTAQDTGPGNLIWVERIANPLPSSGLTQDFTFGYPFITPNAPVSFFLGETLTNTLADDAPGGNSIVGFQFDGRQHIWASDNFTSIPAELLVNVGLNTSFGGYGNALVVTDMDMGPLLNPVSDTNAPQTDPMGFGSIKGGTQNVLTYIAGADSIVSATINDDYIDAGSENDFISDEGSPLSPNQQALNTALHEIRGLLATEPRLLSRVMPQVLLHVEIALRSSPQGMSAYPGTVAAIFAAASETIVTGGFDETGMANLHFVVADAMRQALLRNAATLPPGSMAVALVDIARTLTTFAADHLTAPHPFLGSLLQEIADAMPAGQQVQTVITIRQIGTAITVGDFRAIDPGRIDGPVSASRS